VESCCEFGIEPSDSIKCWEYRVSKQLGNSRVAISYLELVSDQIKEDYVAMTCSTHGRGGSGGHS
jgi:hypothetical protein